MKIEELFVKYRGIEEKIKETEVQLSEKEKENKQLKEIGGVVNGLIATEKKYFEEEEYRTDKKEKPNWHRGYDPGKCDTAYYFVSSITEKEIIASMEFSPKLYGNCPECKDKQSVIMSYSQTEDSPDGDCWEKEAFIICCNKIHSIKKVSSSYRFLSRE